MLTTFSDIKFCKILFFLVNLKSKYVIKYG